MYSKQVLMPQEHNVCPSGPYCHDAPSCISSTVCLLSSLWGWTTGAFSSNSIFTSNSSKWKQHFSIWLGKISLNLYDATQTWDSQQVLLWNLIRFGPRCQPDMSHSAFTSYKNAMGPNILGFTAAETLQCHLSPLLWLTHNLKFSWTQRAACRQLILKTELCVKLGEEKRRKRLAGNTNSFS